ncbi:MAG TPA: hypothetical protein VMT64_00190 [Candidatus Binataceae bacterium]|nr:hypothetical protein [Candidatus Binataceae bacterium]
MGAVVVFRSYAIEAILPNEPTKRLKTKDFRFWLSAKKTTGGRSEETHHPDTRFGSTA